MSIKVIGAGLGRTGTTSLKLALEQLLGGPCYHMTELFQHLDSHTPLWHAAARGEKVEWDQVFNGYVAAVDEPVSIFWEPISRYYPDALIILSVRDADSWWKSARETILEVKINPAPDMPPARRAWLDMILDAYRIIYPGGFDTEEAAKQAFMTHNDRVRRGVEAGRLLEWDYNEGWGPICTALGLPVPDTGFPKSNTTAEFKARRAAAT